jgi:hypothetical protein
MAYNFSGLNDELIQNTEWLWSFFYTFACILLIASIIWFSKLKQMLEYKKFSESLKNEQEMGLDRNNSANDFAESTNCTALSTIVAFVNKSIFIE